MITKFWCAEEYSSQEIIWCMTLISDNSRTIDMKWCTVTSEKYKHLFHSFKWILISNFKWKSSLHLNREGQKMYLLWRSLWNPSGNMDVSKSDIRDFIRIVFVCICWYIVSSSNGVLGKTILSQFPYPMTCVMVQLTSIAVWSPPLLKVINVSPKYLINWFDL